MITRRRLMGVTLPLEATSSESACEKSIRNGHVVPPPRPQAAPDNVVRTVSENARTLKFKSAGFEGR
jgi:hypothetical protein